MVYSQAARSYFRATDFFILVEPQQAHSNDQKFQELKAIVDNFIPLHKLLKIQLVEAHEGFAKLLIPFSPDIIGDPRSQRIHGGIIAVAMDSAGGAAGIATLNSYSDKISTIDMRIDYLRPAHAKDFYCEGQIVRSGNRIIVTSMKAYHCGETEIIAEGKGVFNVRRQSNKI